MGEREPVFSGRSFFFGVFLLFFFFQYERVSTSSLAKVAKAKKISKLLGRKFRRQQKKQQPKKKKRRGCQRVPAKKKQNTIEGYRNLWTFVNKID